LKLWTIQPVEIYESILKKGYYTCDGRKIDKYFRISYKWLCEQMKKKIGKPPKNVQYPVWAWHTRNFKRKKPDLRSSEYGYKGTKMVCLEIEVPDNEVLLSDFDAWHFVLNNCYYNVDCWDEETFDKDEEWLNSLTEQEKEKEIKKSWQGIFNIEQKETDWFARGKWIQANFWVLKKEYIKKVQYFTVK
jgi:hypothetical protein